MRTPRTRELLEANIRVFSLRNLRRLDWLLPLLVLVLATVGIVTLISAGRSFSGPTPFYLKQTMFLFAGTALAVLITCIDYRFLVSLAPLAYALIIGLLVAVLVAGYEVRGGQRWLALAGVRFQPSEQAKLILIFSLAWYLSRIEDKVRRLHYFVPALVMAAIPALLILRQPNLGTAGAMAPITIAMLYTAGCKRWHLVALVVVGLASIPLAWSQLEDYQRVRLKTFVNPAADPQGSGYHTIQSMITVGSGGLTGKGYYQGTQTFLSYLPEHHTDFIFSLLAEEWGFVGALCVVSLFMLLFLRGLTFAREASDMSGSLLAVGIVSLLAYHVFVNIAITIGMMPVTGIPLPFLSYGGTFYITTMMCIGVLFSVYARRDVFSR